MNSSKRGNSQMVILMDFAGKRSITKMVSMNVISGGQIRLGNMDTEDLQNQVLKLKKDSFLKMFLDQ